MTSTQEPVVVDFGKLLQDAKAGMAWPEDDYDMEVIEADSVKAGTGTPMIKAKLRVLAGPFATKTMMNNFVLSVDNPAALGMFFKAMKALGVDESWMAQLGQINTADPNCLAPLAQAIRGKRARFTNKHRPYNGATYNNITNVQPISGGLMGGPADFAKPGTSVPSPGPQTPPAGPTGPAVGGQTAQVGFVPPPTPQPGAAAPAPLPPAPAVPAPQPQPIQPTAPVPAQPQPTPTPQPAPAPPVETPAPATTAAPTADPWVFVPAPAGYESFWGTLTSDQKAAIMQTLNQQQAAAVPPPPAMPV